MGAERQDGPLILSSPFSSSFIHLNIAEKFKLTYMSTIWLSKQEKLSGCVINPASLRTGFAFNSLSKKIVPFIYGSCPPSASVLRVYLQSVWHGPTSRAPLMFLRITVSVPLVQHTLVWRSLNTDTSCWTLLHKPSEIGLLQALWPTGRVGGGLSWNEKQIMRKRFNDNRWWEYIHTGIYACKIQSKV